MLKIYFVFYPSLKINCQNISYIIYNMSHLIYSIYKNTIKYLCPNCTDSGRNCTKKAGHQSAQLSFLNMIVVINSLFSLSYFQEYVPLLFLTIFLILFVPYPCISAFSFVVFNTFLSKSGL